MQARGNNNFLTPDTKALKLQINRKKEFLDQRMHKFMSSPMHFTILEKTFTPLNLIRL